MKKIIGSFKKFCKNDIFNGAQRSTKVTGALSFRKEYEDLQFESLLTAFNSKFINENFQDCDFKNAWYSFLIKFISFTIEEKSKPAATGFIFHNCFYKQLYKINYLGDLRDVIFVLDNIQPSVHLGYDFVYDILILSPHKKELLLTLEKAYTTQEFYLTHTHVKLSQNLLLELEILNHEKQKQVRHRHTGVYDILGPQLTYSNSSTLSEYPGSYDSLPELTEYTYSNPYSRNLYFNEDYPYSLEREMKIRRILQLLEQNTAPAPKFGDYLKLIVI